MILTDVTLKDVEKIRQWRNLDLSMYRTSYFLTKEMQEDFYFNMISNRDSNSRFYALEEDNFFIGMVGLVNISLENRNAEISIVIDPELRGQGYGTKAIELLLTNGFNGVNLENIYGECYWCSPALDFWRKTCETYKVKLNVLPARKFYNGKYYDSIYFNFNKEVIKC